MSAVVVRTALNEDSPRIAELRESLRRTIQEFRGGALLWEERHNRPDMNNSTVYVAELNGYVVGFMVLCLRDSEIEIFEVHVDAGSRGIGAGDAMINAAIAVAQDQRVLALRAEALPGDRDTKNLFERAGLISQRLIMRKQI
jgi:ribosomal protein S18 acetylase RimI-like enzyme